MALTPCYVPDHPVSHLLLPDAVQRRGATVGRYPPGCGMRYAGWRDGGMENRIRMFTGRDPSVRFKIRYQ